MKSLKNGELKKLTFSIYNSNEIKKLSVLQVTNTSAFDKEGRIALNGLYDKHFGPVDNEDECMTCGLKGKYCPGHCGHISLPLLMFNPLFFSAVEQLLQWSCCKCFQLLIPFQVRCLTFYQLQALEYGLIDVAEHLSEDATNFVQDENIKKRLENLTEGKMTTKSVDKEKQSIMSDLSEKLGNTFTDSVEGLDLDLCKATSRIKAVIEYRLNLVERFKKILYKNIGIKKCPNCLAKIPKDNVLIKSLRLLKSKNKKTTSTAFPEFVLPSEIKDHLYSVWKKNKYLLCYLFKGLHEENRNFDSSVDSLFIDVLMVPPSRFRPINVIEGRKCLHPQSKGLQNILKNIVQIENLEKLEHGEIIPPYYKEELHRIPGKSFEEKYRCLVYQLQIHINGLYDKDMCSEASIGVKQMLESKNGILRKNMMGKRVNCALRTVLTPDPYISVDEVGIPVTFAKKLTYPENLTNWNFRKLTDAIKNGANHYPGANNVETKDGKIIKLQGMNEWKRNKLLREIGQNFAKKDNYKIHRHLRDGDIVLLNRQPTLHRPSIMAHKVKVGPENRTLCIHYAVCKPYNADFDGDEMNLHVPQNEMACSEAHILTAVKHQYLGPRDGSPLIGLIQDHIVAATLLTIRGRFFDRNLYQQLVFSALDFLRKPIKLLPPTIMKPEILWSGKQVISTILMNIFPKNKPLTLQGTAHIKAQTFAKEWEYGGNILLSNEMSESEVVICSSQLLCGVLDKSHIGPSAYGLIHCCYEFYGADMTVILLTSLSHLFTNYLQNYNAFSLGIEDIQITDEAQKRRREVIRKSKADGTLFKSKIDFQSGNFGILDNEMKTKGDNVIGKLKRICMDPSGLWKKFPTNNLHLMIESGAKGSDVNVRQISCALGQVELEGGKIPSMISGKTLPPFLPGSKSLDASGFIFGNFFMGLQPQEFFFHCLAGREGFVNKNIKTSESGYLERSLVKHLEGITVNDDLTVRDSDGTIIQFLYGDDGLNLTKEQLIKIKGIHLLDENYKIIKEEIEELKRQHKQKEDEPNRRAEHNETTAKVFRRNVFMHSLMEMKNNPTNIKLDELIMDYVEKKYPQPSENQLRKQRLDILKDISYYKAVRASVNPGEPVGILAGQSIAEPATQMTLNTFHFAGQGEMNVTQGMPRLLEILMHGRKSTSTSFMDLPLNYKIPGVEEKAQHLCLKLSPVNLSQVLASVKINCTTFMKSRCQRFNKYVIRINLLPESLYDGLLYTSSEKILKYIKDDFILRISKIIEEKLQNSSIEESLEPPQCRVQCANNSNRSKKFNLHELSFSESDDATEKGMASLISNNSSGASRSLKFDDSSDDESDYLSKACDFNKELPKGFSQKGIFTNVNYAEENSIFDEFDVSCESPSQVSEGKATEQMDVCGNYITTYNYDAQNNLWCEVTLKVPLSDIDMRTIFENEVRSTVLHSVPHINKAVLKSEPNSTYKFIRIDGVNFTAISNHCGIIDNNKIYTNAIHIVVETLGIEAARTLIIKEIKSIYDKYKIDINLRHLLLIADYMTRDGTYRCFNRETFHSNASPLQQMTFETPMKFLESALIKGAPDDLNSPSARIIVGQLVSGSSFNLLNAPQ